MLRTLLFLLVAGIVARGVGADQRAGRRDEHPGHPASCRSRAIPEMTRLSRASRRRCASSPHRSQWHTYWINPATRAWRPRSSGRFRLGRAPINGPRPKTYDGRAYYLRLRRRRYLLTTITPPKSDLPQTLRHQGEGRLARLPGGMHSRQSGAVAPARFGPDKFAPAY